MSARKLSEWELRQKCNGNILNKARVKHAELEATRRQKCAETGDDFEPQEMKIKLFVPGQDMLDPDRELSVKNIDTVSGTLCVLQESTKVDANLQLYLSLGDIVILAICGVELQQKMLEIEDVRGGNLY